MKPCKAPQVDDLMETVLHAFTLSADEGTRVHPAPPESEKKRALPVVDAFGRHVDTSFIDREIARGAWTPHLVRPEVSGITRSMTILLARRPPSTIVKYAFHGDANTFCPPHWADLAIGSGACGFGCRSCFLMLTFRALRDPLRPVVYTNGEDFERETLRWLTAHRWAIEYSDVDPAAGRKLPGKRIRARTAKDAIGLGIDCSDSLLWEGVTGHARRLIPLFTNAKTNPLGNPLILLTKSANTHCLGELNDAALKRVNGRIPNVVVTMSLNPEPIADLWEGKFPDTLERVTPPIDRRLEALRAAQDMGFEVRVRVDPILTSPGFEDMYRAFFNDMVHRHRLRPSMITLGTYREKTPQLDTWREKWGLPPMEIELETDSIRDGTHRHAIDRAETYKTIKALVASTGSLPEISLCKETHEVRKETAACNARCNCLQDPEAREQTGERVRLPVLRDG